MPANYPISQNTRRDWHCYVSPLFFAFAIFYLAFHAFNGERGIYALFKEKRKLAIVQAELEQVSAARTVLEHRARLLNSSSLDFDLLDEQARDVLGLAGEGEVVYYPPQR